MGFVVTFGVFAAVGVLDGVIVEVVLAEMGCVVVVLVAAVVWGINPGVVLTVGLVGVVIVTVVVVIVVGVPAEVVVGDFPADGVATFCSKPKSRKYQQITVTDA